MNYNNVKRHAKTRILKLCITSNLCTVCVLYLDAVVCLRLCASASLPLPSSARPALRAHVDLRVSVLCCPAFVAFLDFSWLLLHPIPKHFSWSMQILPQSRTAYIQQTARVTRTTGWSLSLCTLPHLLCVCVHHHAP